MNKPTNNINFIVVQVDQDCDHVEGVRHIKSFSTEDEANVFINEKNAEQVATWRKRMDYIEEWVDGLNLPETDFNGWKNYLKQYHPFGARYVLPQDFKENLKGYLKTHHSATIDGYDPPLADFRWSGLHVVEISRSDDGLETDTVIVNY